ncbi:hypothetical protein LCGC14_1216900 [marine sediment metagenome]|uniref:Uncharacterized protein n=1 Tax=marine sediment metagenome TaxID=412755 RepID=A0A0F9NUQ6_9ZZZZ
MAYVNPDYKTKKAFKEAVKAGTEHRPYVHWRAVPYTGNGTLAIEGPHYPKPHTWYASCQVEDGVVVKVR